MRKFIIFWKNFFIMIFEVIKSMRSIRGLFALFIAYMIYHGWAALFFLIGLSTGNAWLIAVGSAVMLFWFGPGTPVIPLILITALFIQRYIFLDQSNKLELKQKWIELNQRYAIDQAKKKTKP